MDHDLEIKIAHPFELREHKDNARRGNVEELKKSLMKSGQYKPIVVNKRSGYVVAGNHTLRSIQELGWDKVLFVEIDVDDADERRIMAADNRIGDMGNYDTDALLALLIPLGDELDGSGYTELDLDVLKGLTDTEVDDDVDDGPIIRYGVIVEVSTLAEQMQLMHQLGDDGLDVRPLHKD